MIEVSSRRTTSQDKDEVERENYVTYTQRATEGPLSRKKSLGSGKALKPYSREKYSNPKRTEESLEKEEQRARLMNADLINNLMATQNTPNYLNKLKIKKN